MNQRDYNKAVKDTISCTNIKRKAKNAILQLHSTKADDAEDMLILLTGELSQYLQQGAAADIFDEFSWDCHLANVKLLALLQDVELIDKLFTYTPKNVVVNNIEHVAERFAGIRLAILNSYNSDIIIGKSLQYLTHKNMFVSRLAVSILLRKEVDQKWENEVIHIANGMLGEINKPLGFLNDNVLYNLSLHSTLQVHSPIDLLISLMKQFNTDQSNAMLQKISSTGYDVEKVHLLACQDEESSVSSKEDAESIQSEAVENFIAGRAYSIPIKIDSEPVIAQTIMNMIGYSGSEHKDRYLNALTYVVNTGYAIERIIEQLANAGKKETRILIEAIGAIDDKRGIEAVKNHVNLKKYQNEVFLTLARLNDPAMVATYTEMFNSKKGKDRSLAVECLCLMQDDTIKDFLLKIFGDQNIDLQGKILLSLAKYNDETGLNLMKAQLSNKKLYPYALAALLKRGDDEAIDRIYDDMAFLSSPIFCEEALVVYLASSTNKKVIRILMQLLLSDLPGGTKAIASLHLNNMFVNNPPPEFVTELKECASDPSPLIRKISLMLMGHLTHDPQVLNIFTQALDDQYYVAETAVTRLTDLLKAGQTLPDEATRKLIKSLSHPSMHVRLTAVNAAQYLGSGENVEKLLKGMLTDRCDLIRCSAKAIIETMKDEKKQCTGLKLTQTASGKYPNAAYGAVGPDDLDSGGIVNREKVNQHAESSLIHPIEKSVALEILHAYLPDGVHADETTMLDMGIWKFAKELTESGSPDYEVFHLGIDGNNQTNFVFLMQKVNTQNCCFIAAKCIDGAFVYAYMNLAEAKQFVLKLNG